MELIRKFERTVHGWSKGTPDLPPAGRRWIGENAWWIVLIGAIVSALAFFMGINSFFAQLSILNSPVSTYYASSDFLGVAILRTIISAIFIGINAVLLFFAIRPLQRKQKMGWALLFFALLVEVISILVSAVLTFSVTGFIITILFGAIGLAIGAYFLFEIHGEFAHDVHRSTHTVK